MNLSLINYVNAAVLTWLKGGLCPRCDTTGQRWLEAVIESLADCGVVECASRARGVFTDLAITDRGTAELPWLVPWA